jgi:cytochrome b
MQRLRLYHALLAVLVVLAFVSGEAGLVHAWLGYGVAAMIALRLVLALSGQPQLGLSRFYPQFHSMRLNTALTHPAISRTLLVAIAVCTIVAVGTGVAMDGGRALGLVAKNSPPATSEPARPEARPATSRGEEAGEANEEGGERGEASDGQADGPMGEAHEFFANLLIALVVAHVSYLLLFKRPLARFMLFLPKGRKA